MTLKEIRDYADVYGWEIVVPELKKKFNFVSTAGRSVPTEGSPTVGSGMLVSNPDTPANIQKVILHKDGSVTIKCEYQDEIAHFKFLNL